MDAMVAHSPEGELAHVLVEILVGPLSEHPEWCHEADGVQVGLQNGLLGVSAAQAEGAVDLAQLAQRTSTPLALLSLVRFLMSCCSSVEAPCLSCKWAADTR